MVGGDFNSIMDPLEGKWRDLLLPLSQGSSHTYLPDFVLSLALTNTWRQENPLGREFTFISSPHNSLSRIDYMFCNHNFLQHSFDPIIGEIANSDHGPISITLSECLSPHAPRIWHFLSFLANIADLHSLLKNVWSDFLRDNAQHAHDPTLL